MEGLIVHGGLGGESFYILAMEEYGKYWVWKLGFW